MNLLYDKDELEASIEDQAWSIHYDFRERHVVFVVLLEGGRRFSETLMHHYKGPYTQLELSAKRTEKTYLGDVEIRRNGAFTLEDIQDKDIVILDDIYDEGKTILAAMQFLSDFKPNSINFATMLHKDKETLPLEPIVLGLHVKNDDWVVGYGMDLNGEYRELDFIYVV